MSKINKKVTKLDRLLNELNDYLGAFNSVLAPRGDGARQCACLEFHQLMNEIHNALYDLEEAQLNKFDWDIESIKLISEMESDY